MDIVVIVIINYVISKSRHGRTYDVSLNGNERQTMIKCSVEPRDQQSLLLLLLQATPFALNTVI